ncbi:hypothetical protein YC2023_113025 [Brassica napus]
MGATSLERHHQVALITLLEQPNQSDREKSLAVSSLGDARTSPERPLGATQRGRSSWERRYGSDREKSLAVSSPGDARTNPERPLAATQRGRSRSLERLNWFDNHYTTTFVLGALKTPNIRRHKVLTRRDAMMYTLSVRLPICQCSRACAGWMTLIHRAAPTSFYTLCLSSPVSKTKRKKPFFSDNRSSLKSIYLKGAPAGVPAPGFEPWPLRNLHVGCSTQDRRPLHGEAHGDALAASMLTSVSSLDYLGRARILAVESSGRFNSLILSEHLFSRSPSSLTLKHLRKSRCSR